VPNDYAGKRSSREEVWRRIAQRGVALLFWRFEQAGSQRNYLGMWVTLLSVLRCCGWRDEQGLGCGISGGNTATSRTLACWPSRLEPKPLTLKGSCCKDLQSRWPKWHIRVGRDSYSAPRSGHAGCGRLSGASLRNRKRR